MIRNFLTTALKLGLALGLIIWLVATGALDLEALAGIFSGQLALVGVVGLGLTLALGGTRWWLLLRSQGVPLKWSYVFSLTLIGNFFNFAIPGGVGGDVVKGYYILRGGRGDRLKAASSILVDRILGFYVLFLLAFAALLFSPEMRGRSPELFQFTGVLFSALTLGSALFLYWPQLFFQWTARWPKVHAKILPLVSLLKDWSSARRAMFWGLLISVGVQGLQVLVVMAAGKALGAEIAPSTYFLLVPLAAAATALPISPAGVGVGQAAAYFLFSLYAPADAQVGPIGFTVLQACLLLWGLAGAILYIRKKQTQAEVVI